MVSRANYRIPIRDPLDGADGAREADTDSTYTALPPPYAHIPKVPAGFEPTLGNEFRGMAPNSIHMSALPDVIDELARFTDFAEVFGKTAPPHELTRAVVRAAYEWSSQRARMRAWDLYCRTQEGLAWRDLRTLMNRLAPAYHLAVTTDSSIAQRYPGHARLLGAARETAKRAAETRKANARLAAEGKGRFKGRAGKRLRQAAMKALYLQRGAAQPTSSPPISPISPPISPSVIPSDE